MCGTNFSLQRPPRHEGTLSEWGFPVWMIFYFLKTASLSNGDNQIYKLKAVCAAEAKGKCTYTTLGTASARKGPSPVYGLHKMEAKSFWHQTFCICCISHFHDVYLLCIWCVNAFRGLIYKLRSTFSAIRCYFENSFFYIWLYKTQNECITVALNHAIRLNIALQFWWSRRCAAVL